MKLRQLSKEDVMFLAGETETTFQHTGGLVLLNSEDSPDFCFESFRQTSIERIELVPNFHWKLHQVPMGIDRPYWIEDEDFSYDHHIKRIAVPSPGDHAALAEVVSHLYAKHLDRDHPLWEMWLIEGLEGGKFAILQKLHHCMMDGQGGNKLGEIMCDLEPNPPPREIDRAITEAKAGRVPTRRERSTQAMKNLSRLPTELVKGMYDLARPKMMEQLSLERRPKKSKVVVPSASFNTNISKHRGFIFGSLCLDDIKMIKNYFDVSLNDVVLALVSGAMRSYMIDQENLPEESLRTTIAVSLRSEDDDAIVNKVTNASITMATNESDPVERLKKINAESREVKDEVSSGAMGAMEVFQTLPPFMLSALMGIMKGEQIPQMMGSNLIVSNVRGSHFPLFLAGVKMESMYPMSIISDGIPVNFTCISYVDKIDLGVTVEPKLFPNAWSIMDKLQESLEEYMRLAGAPQKRARKGTTKT
ncbi:MAG: diacylglycerol O-acyltransferase [Halieaceae bacterium]|jgi:diacylglycerol O-acyltransferase